MKKQFFSLLLFFLCLFQGISQPYEIIKGSVKSLSKGVEGVVITDGKNFTKTNNKGEFRIDSDTTQAYIYYTLPTGYDSPVENGIPVFYQKKNSAVTEYNFEIKKSKFDQKKHTFLVWADPQVSDLGEINQLEKVKEDVNKTILGYKNTPVHAISCGDIVFDQLNLFDNYKQLLNTINIPFYQTIGNHDLDYSNQTNETATKSYRSKFGPDYYSYNVGNVHYIAMNDVFYYGYEYHYMGYFSEKQINWLQEDLKYVKKGTTVVIAVHIPTRYFDRDTNPDLEKRQKNSLLNNSFFYGKLKDYNVHILAGHSHTQWNTAISDSILEHTHAAACGAWWQGEIGLDGTPTGYTVYEVDDNNITWFFKGVGFTKADQFKVYPIGADSENPDAFVANVFNYDEKWKINWYENGKLIGEMQQYWGIDPKAKEIYKPDTNVKYPWMSYDYTNHIFKATPKDKNAKITVEVIDRFGNKYSKSL